MAKQKPSGEENGKKKRDKQKLRSAITPLHNARNKSKVDGKQLARDLNSA